MVYYAVQGGFNFYVGALILKCDQYFPVVL